MSKRKTIPAPPARRLIVAGGAKARTNANGGDKIEEVFPLEPYNP